MSELKRPRDEKWRTGKEGNEGNGGGKLATKGPDKGKRKEVALAKTRLGEK